MEMYKIKDDLKLLGVEVVTFPLGIGEAFEKLSKILPEGLDRAYYGISYFNNEGKIIYKVAAQEKCDDEGGKYNLERFLIEKGEYLTVSVRDWRKKTGLIKDVFHEMMKDSRVSNSSYCVEWYRDDDEMLCMIKAEPLK